MSRILRLPDAAYFLLVLALACCAQPDSNDVEGLSGVQNPDAGGGGDAPTATIDGVLGDATAIDSTPGATADDAAVRADSRAPDASVADEGLMVATTRACGSAPLSAGLPAGVLELLNLGHVDGISAIRLAGERLLSRSRKRFILWDSKSRRQLLSGALQRAPCSGPICAATVGLAGDTLFVASADASASETIRLYDANTATLRATITTPEQAYSDWNGHDSVGIAQDGSYVWVAGSKSLAAWSKAGRPLFQRSGDYQEAFVDGAPNELRVHARREARAIERIALDGSATQSPPFEGAFLRWFKDGGRFFTADGGLIRVYDAQSNKLHQVTLPAVARLEGRGDYFWNYRKSHPSYPLEIYRIGAGLAPVRTIDSPYPSTLTALIESAGRFAWLPHGRSVVSVARLDAGSAVREFETPVPYATTFAAVSEDWAIGGSWGQLYDSRHLQDAGLGWPLALGCGAIESADGTVSGRALFASTTGGVLVVDAVDTAPRVEAMIPFASSQVAISRSGYTAAASATDQFAQYRPDRTLRLFDLRHNALIHSWPYAVDQHNLFAFDLAREGTALGWTTGTFADRRWQLQQRVIDYRDQTILYADQDADARVRPFLSPSGKLIAIASSSRSSPETITRIVRQGSLLQAVPGVVVGWLDDERLLVNRYAWRSDTEPRAYSRAEVYDLSATLLATPSLPEIKALTVLAGDRIFDPDRAAIHQLPGGEVVWRSAIESDRAAIAGPYVVSVTQALSGSALLVAQRY